jgi:hypothetical protein
VLIYVHASIFPSVLRERLSEKLLYAYSFVHPATFIVGVRH